MIRNTFNYFIIYFKKRQPVLGTFSQLPLFTGGYFDPPISRDWVDGFFWDTYQNKGLILSFHLV